METNNFATITLYYDLTGIRDDVRELVISFLEKTVEDIMETNGQYYEMDWYFDCIENAIPNDTGMELDEYDDLIQTYFAAVVEEISKIVNINKHVILAAKHRENWVYIGCNVLAFTDSFMTLGVNYEGNFH